MAKLSAIILGIFLLVIAILLIIVGMNNVELNRETTQNELTDFGVVTIILGIVLIIFGGLTIRYGFMQ